MKIINLDEYIKKEDLKVAIEVFEIKFRKSLKTEIIRKEVYKGLTKTHRANNKIINIFREEGFFIVETTNEYLNFDLIRTEYYYK